jgi:hypothetical protein
MSYFENLHKEYRPDEEFYIPETVTLLLSQIYYFRSEYQLVIEVIEQQTGPIHIDTSKDLLLWHLAAQIKLGHLDKTFYQEFVNRYPDEEEVLRTITQI